MMTTSRQSGFQRGETGGWASAFSVYPHPVPLKDILGAASELPEWRDASPSAKIDILGLVSKKRPVRSKTLAQLTKWTGIEFVKVDTSSDLNVVVVMGRELAMQHAQDLQKFAQQLYERSGFTHYRE